MAADAGEGAGRELRPDHRRRYSSDAIPVHLATREAMAIYKAKLTPHGVVAMHISNRHLELQSVGRRHRRGEPDEGLGVRNNPDEPDDDANYISATDVVIAAREPDDIGTLSNAKTWVLTAPIRPCEPGPTIIPTSPARLAPATGMTSRGRFHAAFGAMRWFGVELEICNSSSFISTPTSPNSGVDR